MLEGGYSKSARIINGIELKSTREIWTYWTVQSHKDDEGTGASLL